MWRLHRPRRRQRGEGVHHPGGAGERLQGHHDRRLGREWRAASDAGGLQGMPRPAVRLLHAGHGAIGDRSGAAPSQCRRGNDPRRAGGQPLPLHRLPQHSQGDRPRRGRHAEVIMGASDLNTVGQSVRRKEDYRFLTGAGQFTDAVHPAHHTDGYFLRSPHAHAKIRKIDTTKAKAAAGVVAVFTGADLTGVNGLPCGWLITGTDGQPMKEPPHPVLAQGKVRYVGDGVALVVAETPDQAKDGAELIDVDYDVLPAVVDPVDALKSGAPQIHDGAPGNKCYTWALATKRRSMPPSPRPRTSPSSTS